MKKAEQAKKAVNIRQNSAGRAQKKRPKQSLFERAKSFVQKFQLSRNIGIDLGTATVLVYVQGKGIVLEEPSVVAVDTNTDTILQVGKRAQQMLGRTPGNIAAVRPLRDGVISQYEVTLKMIEYFIHQVCRSTFFLAGGNILLIKDSFVMIIYRNR